MKQLLSVIFILFFSVNTWSNDIYVAGEIMDKKGNVTKVTRFQKGNCSSVKGIYNGNNLIVSFDKLQELENLGNNIFRITNLMGKVFHLENSRFPCGKDKGKVYFRFFDEISMEEKKQSIVLGNLKLFVINKEIGRLRYNTRTKQFFPEDYVFDPFTGEKLNWKTPKKD